MEEVKVCIEQIRDYVENDKPIAGTVAKDWLRFLINKHDTMEKRIQHLTKPRYPFTISD